MINKREVVEQWLNMACQAIAMCRSASDPYPCEDEDEWIAECDGLIEFYHEDDDGFMNERYMSAVWKSPSDEQVEKLYPIAIKSYDDSEVNNG